MSCRYKNECPSYSGWCEGPKQDFSKCIPFLVTAYENEKQRANRYEKKIRELDVKLNHLSDTIDKFFEIGCKKQGKE